MRERASLGLLLGHGLRCRRAAVQAAAQVVQAAAMRFACWGGACGTCAMQGAQAQEAVREGRHIAHLAHRRVFALKGALPVGQRLQLQLGQVVQPAQQREVNRLYSGGRSRWRSAIYQARGMQPRPKPKLSQAAPACTAQCGKERVLNCRCTQFIKHNRGQRKSRSRPQSHPTVNKQSAKGTHLSLHSFSSTATLARARATSLPANRL